jgi:alkanesulfonate monooxygenase SsuD/methylene tetrahydromethanopterin reductase-like flavin-dependent oxidoreductase (luciferase family)
MEFGILLGDVPGSLPPGEQIDINLRQVEVAQEAGFSYFFVGQHFLYGGGYAWHQPIPLLARIAGEVDPHVTLGTGVMLAPLYHPVLLAEEIATLDSICHGRFVCGLGAGYRRQEFDAFGIDYGERIGRLEESIDIMRGLWRAEGAYSYHGRHWSLESVPAHLRPVRAGGPPIWLGAKSRGAVERAARVADTWLVTSKLPFDELAVRWAEYVKVRRATGAAVRPLPAIRFVVPARTVEDAVNRFEAMTNERLDAYVGQGLTIDGPVVRETRDVRATGFLGPPDDIVEQVRNVVEEVPLDPICVRVAWPTMSQAQILDYIRELGRVIAPLRTVEVATP